MKSINSEQPKQSQWCYVKAHDIVSEFTDLVYCYVCPEYEAIFWQIDRASGDEYLPIVTHWECVD